MDTHRAVFLSRRVGEMPDKVGVADAGQPQRARPLREAVSRDARPGHSVEMTPWIGANENGDAETTPLGDSLQLVVFLRELRGGHAQAGDECGDVRIEDHRPDLSQIVLLIRSRRWGAMHHRAGLLGQRHA